MRRPPILPLAARGGSPRGLLAVVLVACAAARAGGAPADQAGGGTSTATVPRPQGEIAGAPPGVAEEIGDEAAAAVAAARERIAAGDPAGAAAALEPLRARPGAPLEALTLLAALYVDAGQPESALEVLAPLVGADGPAAARPDVLFTAARAAGALGRRDEAEGYLARSAELAPLSRAAVLLAAIRSEQGRHEAAATLLAPITEGPTLDAIAEREPGFAVEISLHHARALLALGRLEAALPHLERATALAPGDAAAWRLLGETLVDLGRIDAARAALARALELEEAARGRRIDR